ncbi:HET-domain-containing protein [Dendrothele bispora CBS 962.96]|uniref:HET-domain-containing protein n=1 Tax=Dendrothele bispora (strain CBS 962.96) TaxID=1314807 RepID=A0A4S8LWY5_DENBC|nr:HET-domain-containing protein [Dendrothele bispora CBS 962.96]
MDRSASDHLDLPPDEWAFDDTPGDISESEVQVLDSSIPIRVDQAPPIRLPLPELHDQTNPISTSHSEPLQDVSPQPFQSDPSAWPLWLIDTKSLELVDIKHRDKQNAPPYAILSHRWFRGEEVTLQEFQLLNRTIESETDPKTSKSGYKKIHSACSQAQQNGLDYIWVDTCCIDKTSHGDVARNIKSMYAYYQNSKVCYVYLADVDMGVWADFLESQWFKRGWTLQELLAPQQVIFFNKYWECIGTKVQLQEWIFTLTGIPRHIISGEHSVDSVDPLVVVRMSWAVSRDTTKPQDRAYCLMGLLGVSIEPDYEESVGNSFQRLGSAFVDNHTEYREVMRSAWDSFYYSVWLARIAVEAEITALRKKNLFDEDGGNSEDGKKAKDDREDSAGSSESNWWPRWVTAPRAPSSLSVLVADSSIGNFSAPPGLDSFLASQSSFNESEVSV